MKFVVFTVWSMCPESESVDLQSSSMLTLIMPFSNVFHSSVLGTRTKLSSMSVKSGRTGTGQAWKSGRARTQQNLTRTGSLMLPCCFADRMRRCGWFAPTPLYAGPVELGRHRRQRLANHAFPSGLGWSLIDSTTRAAIASYSLLYLAEPVDVCHHGKTRYR